jgi:ADP-heptose:LPS heptosyltransferase
LLASTSATDLARDLLAACLAGGRLPDPLLDELIDRAAVDPQSARAFFAIVIERLGDLFEPGLCDTYAQLFARAIERVEPGLEAAGLLDRYERVRRPRACVIEPREVFVLSRITLGADVVVTSTILSAVRERFPRARIRFVGPRKNAAMFARQPRIEPLEFDYARGGTLTARIEGWRRLRDLLDRPHSIVVDPDSRLSQLGLLPIADEERHFFFESRAYGGETDEPLAQLTSRWCAETFGVEGAHPFVVPAATPETYDAAVSFGVGENAEKRIADPFERRLLESLGDRRVILDKGAGGAEAERAERAIIGLPYVSTWQGDYAPFAARIANSRLYVGYDSAGQHVAAALGVPLVSIFAGYASERMFERWRPTGRGRIEVVKVANETTEEILRFTGEAIARLERP